MLKYVEMCNRDIGDGVESRVLSVVPVLLAREVRMGRVEQPRFALAHHQVGKVSSVRDLSS